MTQGLAEFRRALSDIKAAVEVATKAIVVEGSHLLEATAKANFAGSHKRGAKHVGGTMPNVVTGALRASIYVQGPSSTGLGTYSADVGPSTVYARAIELGQTTHHAFGGAGGHDGVAVIPAFPYFGPAYDVVVPKYPDIAARRWGEAISGR